MTGNYFLLARQAGELNDSLAGAVLNSAFSQEKDKLILGLTTTSGGEYFLELSCSAQQPYMLLREQFHRARKNTLSFFTRLYGQKLEKIDAGRFERVIRFHFGPACLCFVVHGSLSNTILLDQDGGRESFKKLPEDDELISMLEGIGYLNPESLGAEFHLEIERRADEASLLKFPALGREMRAELNRRIESNGVSAALNLIAMINETLNDRLQLRRLHNPARIIICPPGFEHESQEVLRESDQLNPLINAYIIESSKAEMTAKLELKISRFLSGEIKFLTAKTGKMREELKNSERGETYRYWADMILAGSGNAPKGSSQLQTTDFNNEEQTVTIKLNPLLSPYENAQYYYSKARNSHKQRENLQNDLPLFEKKLERFLMLNKELEKIKTYEEAKTLAEELNLGGENRPGKDNAEESKYRRFIIDDKYLILVGKDAHNNDQLTLKTAKPNDYWLHARGCSGSHVVIRSAGGEAPPKYVLQAAASLAAYYSKAKTAKMVPVAYTQKKYVIKRKGMDPGQVSLTRESVIMVKPEIPEICKSALGSER